MLSTQSWSEPAVRAWVLARRFQKFLAVGIFGLLVNQAGLFAFHNLLGMALPIASAVAIFISMVVTFALNERWTWHDRGRGKVVHRMAMYFPINLIGLLINVGILTVLVQRFDVHYLVANLFGAAAAAIWNFSLNNHITWRA